MLVDRRRLLYIHRYEMFFIFSATTIQQNEQICKCWKIVRGKMGNEEEKKCGEIHVSWFQDMTNGWNDAAVLDKNECDFRGRPANFFRVSAETFNPARERDNDTSERLHLALRLPARRREKKKYPYTNMYMLDRNGIFVYVLLIQCCSTSYRFEPSNYFLKTSNWEVALLF
jgi:hypothetical protein